MRLTQDELISIISDVTTLLGQALAQHVELTENLLNQGAGVPVQQQKLETLKTKIAGERAKLTKLKDAAKRKKELERSNRQHERPSANEGSAGVGRVALLNAQGRWIGFVETLGNGNVNVFDAKGQIVARELAGLTVDRAGRLVGRGRQGLVVLGRTLAVA